MLFVAAKVSQYSYLPQGEVEAKDRVINMVEQMDKEGFGNCTNTGACEVECPKGISLEYIARMNREYLKASLIKDKKVNCIITKIQAVDSNLDVSIFQIDLAHKDKEQNLNLIDKLSDFHISSSDILLLPEMFNTSFITNDISIAEEMDGPTIRWMKNLAKKKSASVVGTILIKENELYYNRLLWVNKNGGVQYYDKSHLFSLAKEDKYITKGKIKS